ncbi:hypothetical protein [Gloeocapsopsis sp. IPPAS B-1203]|uniref:hypothetical protein n=1 Tax=Gloeocapsopsis sp. IPPAS B-1203 TaxID=2049454 RepID=UPI000C18230B|nr:hypothetical protein [Gloeocapsopsis sp. IPPAS B-1203]PIG93716.1 hypothetical protein CSQ79_08790 [Gloeocapsopsis sp. IPPAS B-1203]
MAEYDLSALAPATPEHHAYSSAPDKPEEYVWKNDFPDAYVTDGREQFEPGRGVDDTAERDIEGEIAAYESAISRQQKELTEPDYQSQYGGAVANTIYTLAEDKGFQEYLESDEYFAEADAIELAPEFANALERTFGVDADTAKHAIAYFGFDDNAVQLFADTLLNRKPKIEPLPQTVQPTQEEETEYEDTRIIDWEKKLLKEENEKLKQQLKTRPVEREDLDVQAQAEYYAKEFNSIKNSNPKWAKLDSATWDYYLSSMMDVYHQMPPAKKKQYDTPEGARKILNYLEGKWNEKRNAGKSSSNQPKQIKTRFKQSEISAMSQAEYEANADRILYAYQHRLVDLNR